MSSKQEAELRRANEELTNAYRQLEDQNQKLRLENQKLRAMLKGVPVKPAPEPAPALGSKTDDVPGPGHIVDYVDKRGIDRAALVLEVLEDGMLKLKVLKHAAPDVVLDARRARGDKQRDCWRRR